jgi:hypothetical protein
MMITRMEGWEKKESKEGKENRKQNRAKEINSEDSVLISSELKRL